MDLLQEYSMDKIKLDSAYGFSPLPESKFSLPNETMIVFQRNPLISYHDQDSIFGVMVVLGKKYQEFSYKKLQNIHDFLFAQLNI